MKCNNLLTQKNHKHKWTDPEYAEGEYERIDEGARMRFYFTAQTICDLRSRLDESAALCLQKKMIKPIPFIEKQPGGIPCWLWSVEEIRNLDEENTHLFLLAYSISTDGPLNELKRDLAVFLGVYYRDAHSAFN